jgi:hypothetical protein
MTGPNTPPPEWPDEIYKFAVDDPVQGGEDGIDNLPITQLEERTDYLRAGQQAQALQITTILGNLTQLTEQVAGSQAEVLANVVQALTGGAGIYNEQFESRWTLIDTGNGITPLTLTDAVVPVAGDDSLDVASTVHLIVGETYVLFNQSGYRQEVTIASILSPNRIRVTPALTGLVTFPAWLGRTDWDVSTVRQATAPGGGIYRTRPLDLGAAGPEPKALLIRHEGVGALDVEWQAAGATEFVDAPWWRRRTVDGQTETQYLLPTSGPTRLRITAVGGAVTVHWIATQQKPAMAEGSYNPAPRPRLISPVQGDQALGPQPVLQIAAYTPPPGLTVAGVVYEVAKVSDNAVVHTSAPQPVSSAYTLPDGVVQQGTAYRFTAKIKASDGSLGDPSKAVTGHTIPDFRVILPPSILTPISGATVETGTGVTVSAFAVLRGTDAQTGVQMQVKRSTQEWADAWDSGMQPSSAPLVLSDPAALMGTNVQVRVRHWGAALGAGPWSAAITVTIDDEIWLTTQGDGEFEYPEDGWYEEIPVGGGASGTASISALQGGGAGFRPNPIVRRYRTKGTIVPYRVGRGGTGPSYTGSAGNSVSGAMMGGQASFIDDVIGEGGRGAPYGTTPGPTSLDGTGSTNAGGISPVQSNPTGYDGQPGALTGYWSLLGLIPGFAGLYLDTRGLPGNRGVGAGGVKRPGMTQKLAGRGYNIAANDHAPSGTVAGQTYYGGEAQLRMAWMASLS